MAWIRAHLRESLYLNTYLLVLIRLGGTGFGFLFWTLAARLMPSEAVGLATGTISAATLLANLAQLGLGYGLVSHLGTSRDPDGIVSLALLLCGTAGLGLALLFLWAIPLLSPALFVVRTGLARCTLFTVLVVTTSLSQLLHWVFLSARRLTFSLAKQAVQAVAAVLLLLAGHALLPGLDGILAGYATATFLGLGLSVGRFLPTVCPGYAFSWPRRASWRSSFARTSLANYIANQFQRAPDTLLPLIAVQHLGASAGASFFAAWTIARSIAAWAASVSESMLAEGCSAPSALTGHLRRALRLGGTMAAALALCMLAGGRTLLSLYGQEYATASAGLLHAVSLAAVPGVCLLVLVSFLRVRDQLRAVWVILGLQSVCGIGFSWMGMSWRGLDGAGLGWVLSQVLVLTGTAGWIASRLRRKEWATRSGTPTRADLAPPSG